MHVFLASDSVKILLILFNWLIFPWVLPDITLHRDRKTSGITAARSFAKPTIPRHRRHLYIYKLYIKQ